MVRSFRACAPAPVTRFVHVIIINRKFLAMMFFDLMAAKLFYK
jgi:hypothetical protein